MHVVLDIDETIVSTFKYKDDANNADWITGLNEITICYNYGGFPNIDQYHLYPGAIAFIQWLICECKIESLTFFSAGAQERNCALVPEILRLVNANPICALWTQQHQVNTFSRESVTNLYKLPNHETLDESIISKDNRQKLKHRREQFSPPEKVFSSYKLKKDLKKVLSDEQLHNAIFIDDMPHHVFTDAQLCHYVYCFCRKLELKELKQMSKEAQSNVKNSLDCSQLDQWYRSTAEFKNFFHFYYLTGLLHAAFQEAKTTESTVPIVLNAQQHPLKDNKIYSAYDELISEEAYYAVGLEQLKILDKYLKITLPSDIVKQTKEKELIASTTLCFLYDGSNSIPHDRNTPNLTIPKEHSVKPSAT